MERTRRRNENSPPCEHRGADPFLYLYLPTPPNPSLPQYPLQPSPSLTPYPSQQSFSLIPHPPQPSLSLSSCPSSSSLSPPPSPSSSSLSSPPSLSKTSPFYLQRTHCFTHSASSSFSSPILSLSSKLQKHSSPILSLSSNFDKYELNHPFPLSSHLKALPILSCRSEDVPLRRSTRVRNEGEERLPKPKFVEPQFVWATNLRASVQKMKDLINSGIRWVGGKVKYKHYDKVDYLKIEIERKYLELMRHLTLEQLKYFFKHNKKHRTGAKDCVLYLPILVCSTSLIRQSSTLIISKVFFYYFFKSS
ncbi:hypothetical protein AMTRI_Chr02g216610 [Amborella trichopoda]